MNDEFESYSEAVLPKLNCGSNMKNRYLVQSSLKMFSYDVIAAKSPPESVISTLEAVFKN